MDFFWRGTMGCRLGEIDEGWGSLIAQKRFQAVPVALALSPFNNRYTDLNKHLLIKAKALAYWSFMPRFLVPVLAQIWPTEVQFLAVSY